MGSDSMQLRGVLSSPASDGVNLCVGVRRVVGPRRPSLNAKNVPWYPEAWLTDLMADDAQRRRQSVRPAHRGLL